MERAQDDIERLLGAAVAHHRAGRLGEAEAAYRAALAAAPGRATVMHNLGVLLAERGDDAGALAQFDAVLAVEPHYAAAHYNRAAALRASGRVREAIAGFTRACALEPDHYEAHRALGFLWLGEGDRGRALDHFARTYELRRGEDRTGIAAKNLASATRGKLHHDAEQFARLAHQLRDGQRFEMLARAYEDVARDVPEDVTPLSARQLDILGEDYNTAIYLRSAPECVGGAVSPRADHDAIMRAFESRPGGAAFFDKLLTPAALAALQRYLLDSTIWHDFSHIGGFVASYLEDGLACPLVLQIADEMRAAFPALLGPHPLSQAWAFKGLEARAAIDAHADDGAVSVNFWVTPSSANLSPEGGGLAVCRVPPPPSFAIRDYDEDREQAVAFLLQNASDTLVAPYRENRAVLFQSRLLHRSDAPEFKKEYENHRINVTLLFGKREP